MTLPPPPPATTPTTPQPPRKSNTVLWIVLGCVGGLFLIGAVGITAAIVIPTVGKVRETARRTVDLSNLRQIVQGALIWANEHDGQLPPVNLDNDGQVSQTTPATIHAVAAALAQKGGLSDASVWIFTSDQARIQALSTPYESTPVLNADRTALHPDFANENVIAWDFATGLNYNLSPVTPVAWTRGLRPDGTWDPATSVYGGDGGYIVFLGGNVQFFRDLRAAPLLRPDGTPTSNILEALPTTARVVGSGPGTMHGVTGRAQP